MEYGHGVARSKWRKVRHERLNPSFNGIWSWRHHYHRKRIDYSKVLILLLMEYGHGDTSRSPLNRHTKKS